MRLTALMIGFILFLTCANASFVFSDNQTKDTNAFQLQPGTRLQITVYREDDLSGIYEIDPAGKLNFPLIGDIHTAGLEVEDFRVELVEKLKKYLVNPQVSISRSEGSIKSISILGHVAKPGVYDYSEGSTLMRLISSAGGFSESANKRKIKIIRIIDQKKKVIVANGLDIIDGKEDDPKIESGDIIFVSESIF